MIATLLHWLGIPTTHALSATQADVTRALLEAAELRAEQSRMRSDIATLGSRLLAARTELAGQRDYIQSLRARIEALEEQQPQRKPR